MRTDRYFTVDEMDDGSRYICPLDGPQPGLIDRRSDDPTDIFAECPQCGQVLRPRPGSKPVLPIRYSRKQPW